MNANEFHALRDFFVMQTNADTRVKGLMLCAVIEQKCLQLGEAVLFPPALLSAVARPVSPPIIIIPSGPTKDLGVRDLVEKQVIEYAIAKFRTLGMAATWLGMHRSNLYEKLTRYGIEPRRKPVDYSI